MRRPGSTWLQIRPVNLLWSQTHETRGYDQPCVLSEVALDGVIGLVDRWDLTNCEGCKRKCSTLFIPPLLPHGGEHGLVTRKQSLLFLSMQYWELHGAFGLINLYHYFNSSNCLVLPCDPRPKVLYDLC